MQETISQNGSRAAQGRRTILSFVALLGLIFSPVARADQNVVLAWNPSTASGVAGYMIHYGNTGTNYGNVIDAGTNTSWNVTGLQEGDTNYFVVAAYDVNHTESAPSNQTKYYVPGVLQMSARTQAHEAATINFPVAPGHTYEVQASTDLQNWVTIWRTTSSTNNWIKFQDPQAVNLKMRFYRTLSD